MNSEGILIDARCRCNVCNEEISFQRSRSGETTVCPHCGMETVLYSVPQPPQTVLHQPDPKPAPLPPEPKPSPLPVEIIHDRRGSWLFDSLGAIGGFLIILATFGIGYAWSRPTTIEDVYNTGLLNDRLFGGIAWTSLGLLGGLFIVAGRINALINELRRL